MIVCSPVGIFIPVADDEFNKNIHINILVAAAAAMGTFTNIRLPVNDFDIDIRTRFHNTLVIIIPEKHVFIPCKQLQHSADLLFGRNLRAVNIKPLVPALFDHKAEIH